MPGFNLVDEPWIPCVLADGAHVEVGLKDALLRSREIREIFDPSPLVTASLHRLLLAILHRNFGPASLENWCLLWNDGVWNADLLAGYFDRWRHRFDLFDETRPFYQVRELEGARRSPSTRLVLEAASGNNATLFDHSIDESNLALLPAQAARYLLASQAYSIGFGKSSPFYLQDSPLTRGLSVLAVGRDLFETLALNLLAYNDQRPLPHTGEDLPVWEQETPAEPAASGTLPLGYLDYLTWQSRSIHLFAEGAPPLVRWCQIQQRLKLGGDPPDPFKCFRRDDKEGYKPVSIDPDRSLWRDSHVLFQQVDQSFRRPEVFNWLARIDGLSRQSRMQPDLACSFASFGLAAEPGKAASVVVWRHERLPLPLPYLRDEPLLGRLKLALGLAEEVGRLFMAGFDATAGGTKRFARPLHRLGALLLSPEDETKANPDTVRQLIGHMAPARVYWSRLETPFRRLLVRLPDDLETDEDGESEYGRHAIPEWAAALRRAALVAFDGATATLDSSARTLKARAVAEREFRGRLSTILRDYFKDKEEVSE